MITIKQGEKVLPVIFVKEYLIPPIIGFHWLQDDFIPPTVFDAEITFRSIDINQEKQIITCNLAQKEKIDINLSTGYYLMTIETKERIFDDFKVHII